MKEHADRILAHHAEAFRQARRHTRTCRACFIPIMDAEGNPGLLGEACTVGAVFLRNLIEAESMLRTSTQPAPQGQKEDRMGSKKAKGKKAKGKKPETPAQRQAKSKADLKKHLAREAQEAKPTFKTPLQETIDEANASEQAMLTPAHEAGPKKLSGLDAAVQVLEKASGALSPKEITEKALAEGLWTPGGKTPAATLASAIIREIAGKGAASRFAKTAPGRFALTTQVPA